MFHIMVLLKFLGSYGNAAPLQKIGHMMGILKVCVNDYVMQACNAILKHHDQIIKWPDKEEHRTSVADSERYMVLLIVSV